ncbi:hypothetical protein IPF86_02735 [Candidatus Nomurabacteria bacterium]|nr:MAG: hypothetical protein IPF86_02735 [Candidatus Nomurabacteria bacterium]
MSSLFSTLRQLRLPTNQELKKIPYYLTRREWTIFAVLIVILATATIAILYRINQKFMVQIPTIGGTIHEGIIGAPRFINPVLAVSDADKDMTTLIYSGLMRKSADGTFIPDLAESYTISADGLTYTFILKKDIFFHDNTTVTVDDVLYTINKIKDSSIKSQHAIEWQGVTPEKIDEATISFTLKQPFVSFLENTTVGILPMHIWQSIEATDWIFSKYNTAPIGSGPYMFQKKSVTSDGTLTATTLKSFEKFALGKPYIPTIKIYFYPNEGELLDAYAEKTITSLGAVSPSEAQAIMQNGGRIETSILPRIFGLFFNQAQAPLFSDKTLVTALNDSIDKQAIIDTVLSGFGQAIDSPIPITLSSQIPPLHTVDSEAIAASLQKDGWLLGDDGYRSKKSTTGTTPLSFSIATGDAPELKATAAMIKADFERIGARAEIKIFDIGTLNQTIIRPRKYDVLLFGQIVSTESDLFAFWHSSQRNDPGLNVAMYANTKTDTALEKAQGTLEASAREELYEKFKIEIKNDKPAIFLYSPQYIYIVDKKINGFSLAHIVESSDRFRDVYQWYLATDSVWKLFTH